MPVKNALNIFKACIIFFVYQITPDTSGEEIGKETCKSPVLQLVERPDLFSILPERLLRERVLL